MAKRRPATSTGSWRSPSRYACRRSTSRASIWKTSLSKARSIARRRWLFGMSLAHVMRQTRGVGDEERGHWLMSCLPNAPPLSLRGTFAPVRGKVVITPHWLERLGFATQVFGLRLSIPVEARGFAEDKHHERKPSEGVTPALTQINAAALRSAMVATSDAGANLNPLKNGSRLSERPTAKSLL
jgi:hypothetical protein